MSAHGGNIYDFAAPDEIVDFSSNINPYGPPACGMDAAKAALGLISRYTDAGQTAIKNVFSNWLEVDPDRFVFGNGASELISAVIAALRPSRLVTVAPTFADYAKSARRLDVPVAEIGTHAVDGFAFPLSEIEETLSGGDLFIACQPNNPTGRAWTEGELRALSAVCASRGGWLMVDECFMNLTHPRAFSCLSLTDERALVLRAITKEFSAPGLRVGFVISEPGTALQIRDAIQSWPLNCVGEAFAIACASNPEPFLSDSAKKISVERARLTKGLKILGYRPYPAAANFILAQSAKRPASLLYERLHGKKILIRRCANFSGLDDWHFRIAVHDTADNDAFLCALASIMD
ncbi:MAG: aminotransferase class I/II-fold pyridoxal phosphate-dependent enzyme [Synergistaceae bacterium]|jgi:threonine-phosphate decarboxylase|nr:aminotransferase class I/II-fold pyridoxal phosphate-dependent enzyme [Synergistaceae bacterium]